VVSHQIHYAKLNSIPWGMSESGYYAFDSNQNYQYRAFGVPSLALRRGQDGDLVVAPYASLMALPIMPEMVVENIRALIASGALNTYGFVEALDYTPSRLPLGQEYAIVKEHMAHHQGMIFISLTNFLNEGLMVRRFHSDPQVESVALLLMEQIPDEVTFEEKIEQEVEQNLPSRLLSLNPWAVPIVTSSPQVHYLSNGRYAVLITNAGSGYSIWKKQAVTRWRADSTLDNWGTWIYIRDENSGIVWSPTCQPMGSNLDKMRVIFYPHKAEFVCQNNEISSRLEILVPPDDDLEIRRLRLTNHTEDTRHLLISSYGEMALAPQRVDQRHPAFNKMFIESEYLLELQALLFGRRLRSSEEEPLYVIHMLVLHNVKPDVQYETNRAHFIGRNRTYRNPTIMQNDAVFSGTIGTTLDPIMAIAQRLEIPPHSTVEVTYITLASDSREGALTLARQYQHAARIDRAFDQARFSSERELRRLALDTDTISHFQKLLSSLPYPHAMLRDAPSILATNSKSQSSLWSYGISGDYPIILVQIKVEQELGLVGELVNAHRFWRNRGFDSTLVILNQRDTGYMQELYHQIHRLIVRMGSETWLNRHDGIFILRAEHIDDADQILLQTAARVCLKGEDGNLESQLATRQWHEVTLPRFLPTLDTTEIVDTAPPVSRPDNLLFDNGFGGFSPDEREYLIYLDHETNTPAPWINVIANPNAGFIISEVGGGFSWAQNSSENRLSTWRNDPVTDMPSEGIYLRDEETAAVWSPTPMPAGTELPYLIRHGWGYSTIEHQSHGLHQTMYYYMAPELPLKFVRIKLKNTATRPRRITITYYIEWILGPYRDMTQQYVIPEFDADRQILMAHNPYSIEFGEAFTFIAASQPFHGLTTDRMEFLGRFGSYTEPAALKRIGLSNTVRAGTDPCGVVQLHVDLPISGEEEVCFILGGARNKEIALQLAENHRSREAIQKAWAESIENWRHILDSIVVRTPDTGMNVLLPWLLYQALSCRIWGRSGLYQSSGAYGFRDQLQDVMSLVHVRPDLTREHILRAARHQFEAGDVLHWWHPPSARGVRTRFSDDLVWLPFVVAHYVKTTGDESILHAQEPFLKGEPLQPDEVERYGFYETTTETYTIYEHCRRALQQADTSGRHNLPLMQAGDWNDGMNRVGIKGHGESVWMGWFLYYVFDRFSPICTLMNDAPQAEVYRRRMEELKTSLESAGWDGEWYRRGYYDDGTPLGSKQSMECQIDSIAQSWAVHSGAAESMRAEQAMNSVEERLIREEDRLILLFTPPFNRTAQDPGYIKGYPPGIRENGGQYTHAALWVVWAYAEMNKGTQAEALFRLLNPIYHSDSPDRAKRYAVEPYVIAADVYSEPPHTGHGGWTWYTGSSGWMYRLGIEAILGLYRQSTKLRIEPRIPAEWSSYEIDYRYKKTTYHIKVLNPNHVEYGVREIRWNGELLPSNTLSLVDDGQFHEVSVVLG
jgi:cyclic beta-1,2-glucan synthetase